MEYILMGLGNKGIEYEKTRHNAGALAVSFILREEGLFFSMDKYSNSLISKSVLEGQKVVFSFPQTFMNESGFSAKVLVKDKTKFILFYDDIDIAIGEYKVSFGRSGGSHNGVKSVVAGLGSKDFITIRIGVSPKDDEGNMRRPTGKGTVQDFVMNSFSKKELDILEKESKVFLKLIKLFINEGPEKLLSTYKSKI
jgi:PTH1 family peptidyl-tRNA hydrolase